MDSFIFNACICVYVYASLFLSTTCSVHLMLLVCGLSGLTGTACPWGRPPFCSQLSSVTFSCLYKVEPSFLIFLNNLYADFQSGWTSLHSYQQCLNLASICFLDDCRSDCSKMASWYQFVPMAQEYNLTLGMVRALNFFFSARSLWLSVIFFYGSIWFSYLLFFLFLWMVLEFQGWLYWICRFILIGWPFPQY